METPTLVEGEEISPATMDGALEDNDLQSIHGLQTGDQHSIHGQARETPCETTPTDMEGTDMRSASMVKQGKHHVRQHQQTWKGLT